MHDTKQQTAPCCPALLRELNNALQNRWQLAPGVSPPPTTARTEGWTSETDDYCRWVCQGASGAKASRPPGEGMPPVPRFHAPGATPLPGEPPANPPLEHAKMMVRPRGLDTREFLSDIARKKCLFQEQIIPKYTPNEAKSVFR